MKVSTKIAALAILSVCSYSISQATINTRGRLVSSPRFEEIQASPVPGGIRVKARYQYMHRTEDRNLVWRLTVAQSNNIIHDEIYDTQVFSIEKNRLIRPTFNEMVPLVSGTYRVVVGIYEWNGELGRPITINNCMVSVP